MRSARPHNRSACSSPAPPPAPASEPASRISSSPYPRGRSLDGRKIALGISEDHIPHRLVIFDVAGTAAEVAVERVSDGGLQFRALDRLFRQTFQQYLGLVQEARGAVAALEREMFDEGFLKRGKLAISGVAFDGSDRLAVEARRRHDTGRAGVAGAVRIIDDHRTAQALRGAAAEFGAGHAKMLAQKIVHGQFVAHLGRSEGVAVDGDGKARHAIAPLSMA